MSNLTISQALRQIKKLKGQLSDLKSRAETSLTHKAAQKPAFDFNSLVTDSDKARSEMLELQARVAVANATTKLTHAGKEMVLALAVRTLEELKGQIAWYKGLHCKAQAETVEEEVEYNYEVSKHIKVSTPWVCALPEALRVAKVDELSAAFESLNNEVERLNHITVV